MELNYQQKIQDITDWIQKTVIETGIADVVVAVSGGIDSAVSLALCVQALGKDHVYALRLPYGKMSTQSTEDAKLVTSSLGLPKEHVSQKDIYKVVNKIIKQIEEAEKQELSEIRKGNIMARMRMIFLYDFAKAHNCLVVGTENKSEYYLGYFTRFGDEASDIEPIRSLYKTQVWEVAKLLGIPQEIIAKKPSAGLWEGQTDEKEFGFSYEDADQVLYHRFDKKLTAEAMVQLGLSEELVGKVLARIGANNFKHHMPKVYED